MKKREFNVPKLTENKEIREYLELLFSLNHGVDLGGFDLPPKNGGHWIQVMSHRYIFAEHDLDEKVEFVEIDVDHFMNDMCVDGFTVVKTGSGETRFDYYRHPFNVPLEAKEIYFLNSKRINWDDFAKWLKLKCIENL